MKILIILSSLLSLSALAAPSCSPSVLGSGYRWQKLVDIKIDAYFGDADAVVCLGTTHNKASRIAFMEGSKIKKSYPLSSFLNKWGSLLHTSELKASTRRFLYKGHLLLMKLKSPTSRSGGQLIPIEVAFVENPKKINIGKRNFRKFSSQAQINSRGEADLYYRGKPFNLMRMKMSTTASFKTIDLYDRGSKIESLSVKKLREL